MDGLGAPFSSNLLSSGENVTMNVSSSARSWFPSSPSSSSLAPSSLSPAPHASMAGRVGRCIHIMITCVFAAVGSVVGAVTGGLIGLATESGLLRGAGIGAISGAVFTIDAFESSLFIWRSNESRTWTLLYMVDIFCSLLSGRLVREKVGPAMRSAVQSQMSAVDSPLMEAIDIFDTGGAKGMTRASVDRLPKVRITAANSMNDAGERICCVVCLQDFEVEETVRCLPHCQHKFHLPCIDGWLTVHGSCPLCRRDF